MRNFFIFTLFDFFSFPSPITFEMKSMLISFYDIIYFLIIILVFTLWVMFKLILNFYINKKNLNSIHFSFRFLGNKLVPNSNFQIEIIWTVIPIIIFYFIYIPVFKLLGIFGYDDYQYNLNQGNTCNYDLNN